MSAQIETQLVCPLGSVCQEIRDGKIYRCAWFTKLVGKDPQSNKEYDEEGCAMQWLPILLVENAQTNRGQTQAIESFRNEMVQQQEQFTRQLAQLPTIAAQQAKPVLLEASDNEEKTTDRDI